MNPEFRRNLWLELSPRRLMTMTAVLLLIFFAAVATGSEVAPASVAVFLYYFIVVLWGTRNAATAVVGEIRDRTWDFQRLSSLGAGQMTWGKLFGATVFNWYGGALCLAVIVADRLAHQGPLAALLALAYFLIIGVIAQSASLLASLVAALRRQTHTRLEVFVYQAVGLLAASVAYNVWEIADPAGALAAQRKAADVVSWWGLALDARAFLLLSLAAFAGWLLIGCYRAMRLELKMQNGPLVWLGFLLFMGLYVAGFDAWFPRVAVNGVMGPIALRLALAAATYAIITYAMVLLEPKDRVLYRRMGSQLAKGEFLGIARSLQGWMMSCKATYIVTIALIVWLVHDHHLQGAMLVAAALAFLSRDVAIFVLLQTLPGQRRGDFAALVTLLVLYVLAPAIAHGLGLDRALAIFYPQESEPLWLGPAIAWAEALTVAGLTVGRLGMRGGRAAA